MPTISGRSNLPDDSQPLVGEWKIGLAAGTVDDGDGTWRGGVRVFSTDDAGNLTVTLPATKPGEAYTAEFTSRRGPKVNVPRFTFELTADRTWADIIEHPSIPPITPSNVAQVEADRAAVAADRAAVEAIGTTTDAMFAGRINSAGSDTDKALKAKYVAPLSKTTTGAAAPLTYFNVKDYGAVGDGVTDDTAAIQAAIDAARNGLQLGTVLFPTGNYATSATLNVGTTTTNPVRLLGAAGKGSLFSTPQPVRIIRTDPAATFTMLQATGRGLHIEGINVDGQYGVGTLLEVNQGFELVLKNIRLYRSGGAGLIVRALANSSLNDVHVDNCGSVSIPAVTFGSHVTYGLSNTVNVTNMHIERSPGVDLSLGDIEYVNFNGLHIEGAIDNSTLTAYKPYPLVKVGGDIKNVVIRGSFLFTGAAEAIVVDYDNTGRTTGQTVLTVSDTTFFGQPGVGDAAARPARLVDLVRGNGVVLFGNAFKFATSEYVRIQSTFGPNVLHGLNRYDHTITAPYSTAGTGDVVDQRSGAMADPGMAGPIKAARLAAHGNPPTAAALTSNGSTPAGPTIQGDSNDTRGVGYFGSGAAPSAGAQVRVTFARPYAVAPVAVVVPANAATEALGLFASTTTTYMDVWVRVAPGGSQANGTYKYNWIIVG